MCVVREKQAVEDANRKGIELLAVGIDLLRELTVAIAGVPMLAVPVELCRLHQGVEPGYIRGMHDSASVSSISIVAAPCRRAHWTAAPIASFFK
jgi:hypothetical protein